MRNFYISSEYENNVKLHIYGNWLIQDTRSPIIMGIFGPTGEGKTFQLEQILKSLKIDIIDISAGELENENSGYPAQLLRTEYIAASNSKAPTVLVINDIDSIIGKWGDLTQYTVNRQNVSVQLMHFCDNPYDVAGQKTKRVPIFLTGNNPSILYEPLMRPGRMRIYEWKPDVQEKIKIVSKIFDHISIKYIEVLVKENREQPISFWSDMYSILWDKHFLEYLENNYSPREINRMIVNQRTFAADEITISLRELQHELTKKNSDLTKNDYLLRKNY